jgi:hypothetical protein
MLVSAIGQGKKEDVNQESQALIGNLKEQVQMLKHRSEQAGDFDIAMNKVQRLQREMSEMEEERTKMVQKINRLEAQKTRLESVFKTTMKSDKMGLIDEVQLLVRRIEHLEEQNDQRTKVTYLENQEPYLREIEMLKGKLTQEKEMRDQIIQKKNAEVSYFKAELDALLSELSHKVSKKQASRVQ